MTSAPGINCRSNSASMPAIEQAAIASGAKSYGPAHHRRDYDATSAYQEGYNPDYENFFIVEFSPESCPTLRETLNAIKQWAQTPGVTTISTSRPVDARLDWFTGR